MFAGHAIRRYYCDAVLLGALKAVFHYNDRTIFQDVLLVILMEKDHLRMTKNMHNECTS